MANTASSDVDLMVAALADPESFGLLFDRHYLAIYSYLARRLGASLADDVTAEVFALAFEKLGVFDTSRQSALPWLYGIASNLVRRHRRSEVRRYRALARLPKLEVEPAGDEALVDRITASQVAREVLAALADLPVRDREPLILHAWEGLSYEAVAEALAIPVGTVRSRINRARRNLRELVLPIGEEEEARLERGRNGRT